MAGGTKSGLNGMPRDPVLDPRLRRALSRLSGTTLVLDEETVTVNASGEISAIPESVSFQLAEDAFRPRPAPQLASQALSLGSAADSQGILASQIFGG